MGEAKRRKEHEQAIALAVRAVLPFDSKAGSDGKREVPTEFRLFHAGVNHTAKGDFVFDAKASTNVMAAYKARKTPLMGDYEHMSLAQPPIKAPASITEFTPEIRPDANGAPELWATNVQWTDEAKGHLERGEYRLYSPAFMPDADGRIEYLINVALTNLPATFGLEPLVAASDPQPNAKDKKMDDEKVKELTEKLAKAEELCGRMKATVEKLTGKSFDQWASEEEKEHEEREEEAKSMRALKAKVTELTGKSDLAECIAAVSLAVSQAKELVALKAQIEKEKGDALNKEFDSLIASSVEAGKLPPAQKDLFVSLRADFGTERALNALKKSLPSQAIVQLSAPNQPTPAEAVDPVQMQIASMCAGQFGGVEAFKKLSLQAQAAGK